VWTDSSELVLKVWEDWRRGGSVSKVRHASAKYIDQVAGAWSNLEGGDKVKVEGKSDLR
jgi:hypothetical protein